VADTRVPEACAQLDGRVRASVRDSGFAAVLAMSPANVAYLSGLRSPDLGTLPGQVHAVIWPAHAEPVIVVPPGRSLNWTDQNHQSFTDVEETRPRIDDIRPYGGDSVGMARMVADVLTELGVVDAVLGVDLVNLPSTITRELSRLLPTVRQEDAGPMLDGLRAIKSPAEVALMTEVNRATAECLELVLASARLGDTELQIAARLTKAVWERGAHACGHALLAAGRRSKAWRPVPSNQPLDEGVLIRASWGIRINGYASNIARNAVVGRASAAQRDRFARISEVHDTIVDAILPGVRSSDLCRLAQREYKRLGLDYNWGSIGHGIGLLNCEPPLLLPDIHEPVVAGMMLAIDLGHFSEDEAYQIEDLVHVTVDGAVNITQRLPGRSLIESLY
jgi:Xaa-Pro aminopeptidase